MRTSDLILAYFSPETLLPVTSIVATIAGIVMILGKGSLLLFARLSRRQFNKRARVAGTSKPHLRLHEDARSQATGL